MGEVLLSAVSGLIGGLVAAGLAFIIQLRKENHSRSQNLVVERLSRYSSEVGEQLNVIYSYIERVGSWKELSPPQILIHKRKLDKAMHVYRPIWSDNTFNAYQDYMNYAFVTNNGHGTDAKILGVSNDRSDCFLGSDWLPKWDDMFTGTFSHDEKVTHANKYHNLISSFSADFDAQ